MEIFSFILNMLLAIGFHFKGDDSENNYFKPTSNFLEVVNVPAFVDKTHLIKHVFNGLNYKLITAPRRFGKSTNMDMLNTFLSIPLSSSDREKRLQIFQRLKIYEESPEFVNQTFGTYPVLNVDFKINRPVRNYNDAVSILAKKVHKSYLKHKYLISSSKLDENQKNVMKKWCCDESYLNMKPMEVTNGLENLAFYLYRHYNNTKVFLLVDEYDAIISNAMFRVNDIELDDISGLIVNQISDLVKSNDHVDRAVIIGILHIAGSGLSGMNNLKVYKFLDDHLYVSFYGFLEEEVNSLFTKFNISPKEAADARDWYDGYVCRNGRRIYSTYSILNFFQEGKVKSYWKSSSRVEELEEIFRYNPFENYVRQMSRGECVEIELVTNITTAKICELRDMITDKTKPAFINKNSVDLFFSFLHECGYLSFDSKDKTCVMIPNREIEGEFTSKLKKYYITKYKLDVRLLINCANFFNTIIPIAEKTTKSTESLDYKELNMELNSFNRALGALLSHYKEINGENLSNEADLEHIMFAMTTYATGFTQKSQRWVRYRPTPENTATTEKSRLDLYLYKGSFATIIELKHHRNKNPNSHEALTQIINKQYCNVFNQTPKYFLLIGLAINNKQNISVSCLLNTTDITQAVTVP